jgi:hypothetical protein
MCSYNWLDKIGYIRFFTISPKGLNVYLELILDV